MAETSYQHRVRRTCFSVIFAADKEQASVARQASATAQWGGHLILDQVHPHDNLPTELEGVRLPIVTRDPAGNFLVSTAGVAANLAASGKDMLAMQLHAMPDAALVVPIERVELRTFPPVESIECINGGR